MRLVRRDPFLLPRPFFPLARCRTMRPPGNAHLKCKSLQLIRLCHVPFAPLKYKLRPQQSTTVFAPQFHPLVRGSVTVGVNLLVSMVCAAPVTMHGRLSNTQSDNSGKGQSFYHRKVKLGLRTRCYSPYSALFSVINTI